ncbi:glutamine--fructose-6-phosphate transaminase (isomerizing) [Salinisphaera orenii]|uniref:glutamine--fructose-6-phosphate transaminase (isomerizing) n=1 Tax=Salinisphaera orenii TaxID=856731 RepID=UPI000DBE5AB1
MCGIVGATARRDVEPILLEGLRRLEYRGYDSAGVALVHDDALHSARAVGKVDALAERLAGEQWPGTLGIAHTRWATHGGVSERNAHPQMSGERVAVVHNGIIENHAELASEVEAAGYALSSGTDTEVVAHLIDREFAANGDLTGAVRTVVARLHGAYALAVVAASAPETLVVARQGSPLVVGVGIGEHFAASDVEALLPVTRRFIYLQDGDVATLTADVARVTDANGALAERDIRESALAIEDTEKNGYRHFMRKEILAQPEVIADTLGARVTGNSLATDVFGPQGQALLDEIQAVHIVACGTSYHAGLVAGYAIEALARVPCRVELASEFRYRDPIVGPGTLLVTLSQSGETADTLAALRYARSLPAAAGYRATLAICNKPETSLTRESDYVMLTHAGPEIGVASTKAFTTQCACLLTLAGLLAGPGPDTESLVADLGNLQSGIQSALAIEDRVAELAAHFTEHAHALFLGRGAMVPIAMEGALKLKEISYIHAEAYAAGELKHGPLALVDEDMPVVAVAPNNELLAKLKANLAEVRARHGRLYVFADASAGIEGDENTTIIELPHAAPSIAPIVYNVPLQLLAYHVALARGTDVDQPRNLAKSVTVE